MPRRDRPSQFAGVRTDLELNEIDEPVMEYCQPARDYLPDPEACLLTGITPQTCLERGVPEHAFAGVIEQQLARSGTIGVGYNSIRFDDEVTRHLFWRNLIDPYGREWQNGCSRWDLLDVVRCTWALRPEGINWPKHDDGRASFKLEHLTVANGLTHEAAHDALSDVRATIALAKLIRNQQPRLFEFCLKLRKKDAVLDEIGVGRPFLHISGMYPIERGGLGIVWPLAPHPSNKNEIIVWDLAHDPTELFSLDAATARNRMFSRADDLPSGVSRLPIKTIHINKSPIVIGNLKTLSSAVASKWGLDVDQALRHAEVAQARAHTLAGLWPEVFGRPESEQVIDVDEDLYGGFIGPGDRRILQRLLALPPQQRAQRLAERSPAFDDARLDDLLFRYRARNFLETLNETERQRWSGHCRARLYEGAGGATTLAAFVERVDELGEPLLESDDERGQNILAALQDYAAQIAP